jgi:hypothetical protein
MLTLRRLSLMLLILRYHLPHLLHHRHQKNIHFLHQGKLHLTVHHRYFLDQHMLLFPVMLRQIVHPIVHYQNLQSYHRLDMTHPPHLDML